MIVVSSRANTLREMDEQEFLQWQTLLERRTGVWIPEHRKTFLVTKLNFRMREHGIDSYRDYYHGLAQDTWNPMEWAALIDLLTVHETRFNRDPESLKLVEEHCQSLLETSPKRQFKLWSVGCSTGEEVYTLAMLFLDLIQRLKYQPVYYEVIGTDISFPALATAEAANYPVRRLETFEDAWKTQYIEYCDDKTFELVSFIKEHTKFEQGNIVDIGQMAFRRHDVIYCQNVLIYFKVHQRIKILDSLVERLEDNGLLVLAPGEITNWKHPQMARIDDKNCLAFKKIKDKVG